MPCVAQRGPEGDRGARDSADRPAGVGKRSELPQHDAGDGGEAEVGIETSATRLAVARQEAKLSRKVAAQATASTAAAYMPGPAPPESDDTTPRIPTSAQTPHDVRCGRVPPRSTSTA